MTASQGARLALTALIWGTTWTVIRWQIADAPAAWSVAYRFWIAAAAMALWCRATGESLALGRQGRGLALAAGVLQFTLNFNLVYLAEHHVTSGLVAVCFALLVIPNTLLAWAWLGQRVSPRFLAGSAVAVAGVALLFRQQFAETGLGGEPALGLALALGATLAASTANVLQAAPATRAQPAFAFLTHAMLYGAVLDTAVALALEGAPPVPASPRFWAGCLYLALVASAAAFAVYYALIREIGPARASYSSLAVPFVAMALSTLLEGYQWTADAVAGGCLAAIGIALALTPPTRRLAPA